MKSRHCELCNAYAAVYCPSDAAFLCWTCDSQVHAANFLVARHVRRPLCGNLTGADSSQPPRETCNSCPDEEDEDGVLSSGYSLDCVSRTTSPAKEYSGGRRDISCKKRRRQRGGDVRRVDFTEAEGIFVEWCGKIGVGGADVAVGMACRGLRACSGSCLTVLPFRVCLAASMWLGLRLSGDKSASTWRVLKRVEEISGVPAKVIVAAELKLERGFRRGRRLERRRLEELEEGWAEC